MARSLPAAPDRTALLGGQTPRSALGKGAALRCLTFPADARWASLCLAQLQSCSCFLAYLHLLLTPAVVYNLFTLQSALEGRSSVAFLARLITAGISQVKETPAPNTSALGQPPRPLSKPLSCRRHSDKCYRQHLEQTPAGLALTQPPLLLPPSTASTLCAEPTRHAEKRAEPWL